MPRFIVSHNIPSPYRLHLFRALRGQLEQRGWDFAVHFMADGHSERPDSWRVREGLGFQNHFHKDLGLRIVRGSSHINPSLVRAVRKARADVLLLGGIWDNPTNALLAMLRPAKTLIGWFEGNTMTPGSKNPILRLLKRRLMARCHAWAVPGIEGQRYGQAIATSVARPFFTLPNLVDESQFLAPSAAQKDEARAWMRSLGVDPERPVIVLPARLKPIKGVLPFLQAFAETEHGMWQLLVIGEGELESDVRARIERSDLAGRAFLSRYVPYERMPGIYAVARAFCLPSLVDPNPLSVVEAMHSGLPLLLSLKAGNHPEALAEGENGFGFDPNDGRALRSALSRLLSCSEERRLELGAVSRRKAAAFWSTERSLSEFADRCLALHAAL